MISKKYSIFSLASVGLSTGNLILLFTSYSNNEDLYLYLLVTNICTLIQLFTLTPFEQFIHHYIKARSNSPECEKNLFTTSYILSFAISFSVALCIILFSSHAVLVIAPGIKENNIVKIELLLECLSIYIILSTPLYLLQQKLNADSKIIISYILTIIPLFLQSTALIFSLFTETSITYIATALSIGYTISSTIGIIHYRQYFIDFKLTAKNEFKSMAIESLKVRMAHNIHNFGFIFALNHFTSLVSIELASILLTGKRCSDALIGVVNGPLQKTLPTLLSNEIGIKNKHAISTTIKGLNKYIFRLYLILASISLLAYTINLFFIKRYSEYNLYIAYTGVIYLLISLFTSIEAPHSTILSIKGHSGVFYATNIVFIFIIYSLLTCSTKEFYHLSIPGAILIAQIWVYINNKRAAIRLMNQ